MLAASLHKGAKATDGKFQWWSWRWASKERRVLLLRSVRKVQVARTGQGGCFGEVCRRE